MKRWPRPTTRTLLVVVALMTLQALAVVGYSRVTRRRARNAVSFPYEQLPASLGPDLQLVSADGSTRSLSSWRGRPVLLHFWATWCSPCTRELPAILALARREGFELVALSLDKDWAPVRAFFREHVPPEVMMSREGSAAACYEVSSLPDTYLLGGDGSMRLRMSGARDWESSQAQKILQQEMSVGPTE